jgi:hypothetical protein
MVFDEVNVELYPIDAPIKVFPVTSVDVLPILLPPTNVFLAPIVVLNSQT